MSRPDPPAPSRWTPWPGHANLAAPERGLAHERLGTLFGEVHAIALTLLVLEVKLPEGLAPAGVPGRRVETLPRLGISALGFTVIGVFWMAHHVAATLVRRTDSVNLLFIGLMPFSAATVSTYPGSAWAAATLCLNMAFVAGANASNFLCGTHRERLTDAGVDAGLIRGVRRASLGPALGLLLAAGLPLWSPALGLGPVVALVLVSLVNLNLFQHRVARAQETQILTLLTAGVPAEVPRARRKDEHEQGVPEDPPGLLEPGGRALMPRLPSLPARSSAA